MGLVPTVRVTNADGEAAVINEGDLKEWQEKGFKLDAGKKEPKGKGSKGKDSDDDKSKDEKPKQPKKPKGE